MITFTFDDIKIRCLIGSGSDTSFIKPNVLKYEIDKLDHPSFYKSFDGFSEIEYKMISPIPTEFNKISTLNWKIFSLKSEKCDAIIWIHFLKHFVVNINLEIHEIKLFDKYIIPFE